MRVIHLVFTQRISEQIDVIAVSAARAFTVEYLFSNRLCRVRARQRRGYPVFLCKQPLGVPNHRKNVDHVLAAGNRSFHDDLGGQIPLLSHDRLFQNRVVRRPVSGLVLDRGSPLFRGGHDWLAKNAAPSLGFVPVLIR